MNRIKLSDIKWLLVLLCLPFVSSCKDDLEAYEEAEIPQSVHITATIQQRRML